MEKELLVLAKSHKPGGFCVAGVEVVTTPTGEKQLTHNWVRPVLISGDGVPTGAMPRAACTGFHVLDIIQLDVQSNVPVAGQPENWLWTEEPVRTVDTLPNHAVVGSLIQPAHTLWADNSASRNDAISADALQAQPHNCSLMMVKPADLAFTLELQETSRGVRPRIYASFSHNGRVRQRIPLTDPVLFRVFKNQFPEAVGAAVQTSLRHRDNYWLTMSLSPKFGRADCHYMLVAAVIDQSGYLNRNYR